MSLLEANLCKSFTRLIFPRSNNETNRTVVRTYVCACACFTNRVCEKGTHTHAPNKNYTFSRFSNESFATSTEFITAGEPAKLDTVTPLKMCAHTHARASAGSQHPFEPPPCATKQLQARSDPNSVSQPRPPVPPGTHTGDRPREPRLVHASRPHLAHAQKGITKTLPSVRDAKATWNSSYGSKRWV